MKTEEVNTEDQRYALAEEAIFGALNQLAETDRQDHRLRHHPPRRHCP